MQIAACFSHPSTIIYFIVPIPTRTIHPSLTHITHSLPENAAHGPEKFQKTA